MGFFNWRDRGKTAPDQSDAHLPAPGGGDEPRETPGTDPVDAGSASDAVGETAPASSPNADPALKATAAESPSQPKPGQPPAAPAASETSSDTELSTEDQLLAMVKNLVHMPAAPAESVFHSDFADPGPQRADNYARASGSPAAAPPGEDTEATAGLAALAPTPTDEELEQLRRLLLGREIEGVESLYRYLANPDRLAQSLSQVVTEAIRLRVRRDNELIGVLKPTVDNIVRNSVRNNPAELADHLFPVIGPAIRRSISESIRGRLQEFSRTLEKSLSFTGLKWYMEAKRTGLNFSEVVMLKTLEYLVEQVFVIYAEDGTLLIRLVNEEVKDKEEIKDGDQVAAMLTAIQQFVNDSFTKGELSTLEFGDRNIFVARAPKVYMACVVRGQAPPNLRIDMQTALELLVMEHADDLDNFNGDTGPFDQARRHFEALLTARFKDADQKLPWRAKLLPALLLLTLLAVPSVLGYEYYKTRELERRVHQAVSAPGLVPLRIDSSIFGHWTIVCLKDDLAGTPEADLTDAGLPSERYSISYLPYVSEDHEIVAERLKRILADRPPGVRDSFDPQNHILTLSGSAPINWVLAMYERLLTVPGLRKVDFSGLSDPKNGVTASLDDFGVLHLQGRASIGWREAVREQVLRLSGISGVDLGEVEDDEDTRRVKELTGEVNRTVIFFPLNKDQPVPEDADKLRRAVEALVDLEKLARAMDLAVTLTVYGHADATGGALHNYELSQARAKTLAAMLYSRGSSVPVSIYGLGADFAAGAEETAKKAAADQASRKIELRVHLYRQGTAVALD